MGGIPKEKRLRIYEWWSERFGRLYCWWCEEMTNPYFGKHLHNTHPPDMTTIDHLKPKSHGGTNQLTNLVIACRGCNQLKAGNRWFRKD